MEAIRIENLRKEYKDVTAVNNLNLSIEKGELFSLLGVNGAGKTTTIKILSGLSRPSSGDAYIMGKSVVKESGEAKARIGISPQETAVAPNLSVKENLELMCGVHGFTKKRSGEKVREICDSFNLNSILNKRASKLSGGWQRRLSIAMALVGEPQVLFLDEPTLGLDIIARNELWELIKGLKEKITIILTSHYMEESEALSDRIGIMKSGRLIALGTAAELKAKAGTEKFDEAFVKLVQEAK